MLGNKILLTYKRKRLSTKLHGHETFNLPTDGTNDERSDKHSSEFQRIKSADPLRCIKCNDTDNLIKCDDCGQSYHLGCLHLSEQATHQGKNLCLMCAWQQESSARLLEEDPGKSMSRKDIEGSDSRKLIVSPVNLKLSSPVKVASKSDTGVSTASPVQEKSSSAMITFSRKRKKKDLNVSLGSRTSKSNERISEEGCSVEVISKSKAKHTSYIEAREKSASEARSGMFGNENKSKSVSSIDRPEAVQGCSAAKEKGHEKLDSTHFESSSNNVVMLSAHRAAGKFEPESYKDDSLFVSSADDKEKSSNFLRATNLIPDICKNGSIDLNLNLPVQASGLPGSSSSGLLLTSNELVDDYQSVRCTEVSRIESSSAEGVISLKDDKNCPLSMPVTLKKNCLQLFSDDNHDGSSSRAKKATADCTLSQKRKLLQLSAENDQEKQSSSQSPLSLGLSLSTGPKNVGSDLPNFSNIAYFSSTLPREYMHDAMLLSSRNQTSSYRHQLMLDSIINRARGFSARGSFLENPRLCSVVWPEDELDCLWVGVRRHGKGNWDAMLRDSKLQFAPWRVPNDLAEKWEEEVSKLFTGTQFSQYSHPNKQHHITNCNSSFLPSNIRPRKESLMDNTSPSFGYGYADRTSHVFRRPSLNPGNHHNETAQLRGPLSYQMKSFHSGHHYGESLNDSESRLQLQDGPLPVKYPLSNPAESDRLPHWLRDAVSTNLPNMETSPTPKISCVAHSGALRAGHSYSDPSDPYFAMKNSGFSCSRETDLHPSDIGRRINSSAAMRQKSAGLRRHSSLVNKPETGKNDNVIIIDSDASSEETISDNCGRQYV